MRSIITIAMALSVLATAAQEEATGTQVVSVLGRGPDSELSRRPGGGREFATGQPMEPVVMRAITWEFGDGSFSRVLPPRPWRPSDRVARHVMPMAPLREHNGGSPCVAVAHECCLEDATSDPHPYVVMESGEPVLVTTGSDDRLLAVRMLDAISGAGPVIERGFASGRWALPPDEGHAHPVFITLQDVATGERWRTCTEL